MGEKQERTKYLYGASVQGIQEFIFQTNKLKEIVGASELVEQICTTAFEKYDKNGQSVVRAAGNIKYIFDKEEDCKGAVLNFPKEVMKKAPGITISQAVVKYDDSDFGKAVDALESKLKTQRNKPVRSMTMGLMAIQRAPRTGLPAVEKREEDGMIDEASKKKIAQSQATRKLVEKSFGESFNHTNIAYNIEDITGKNNWIAVIHADGNGLGNIFREIGKDATALSEFSSNLDDATALAAREAFKKVKTIGEKGKKIPIRPVVLSGDDFTAICRGDFAVDYAKAFMEEFEKATKSLHGGLTVCAGIAFVKSSYPFHYAIELAESLCSRAKKAAKKINPDLAPSCLMFHKVQDSFVENFNEIAERELKPQPNLSFENGPYYIHGQSTNGSTITQLLDLVTYFEKANALKSHIRQWCGMLYDSVEAANQKLNRAISIGNEPENEPLIKILKSYAGLSKTKDDDWAKLSREEKEKATTVIPFYDALSLASIQFIETKKEMEGVQ